MPVDRIVNVTVDDDDALVFEMLPPVVHSYMSIDLSVDLLFQDKEA